MINYQLLLIDGTLLTVIFAVFVIGTLLWKPRIWLHDFPADLQALIPPKTKAEKRLTTLLAVPLFAILLGGFLWTATRYGTEQGFWSLVLHVYLIWQMINVFDLLVIDCGGLLLVDPMNPPFPGTEGAAGYRNFRFHLIGFFKGSIGGALLVLAAVGIMWLFI